MRDLLAGLGLATVCQAARCPNMGECFRSGTATFLILGETCTRSCRFCAILSATPLPPRHEEPQAVADACRQLKLRHVVITSVTRDDLPDGGALHFARTIAALRNEVPHAVIEVLTSDFQGRMSSVDFVLDAQPDIFSHNVETVPRLYPRARPQADYRRSLAVLAHAKSHAASGRRLYTKSGLMVGLGETTDEVFQVLRDLRQGSCDMLTIGQYLRPCGDRLPVERFVTPEEFGAYGAQARAMGFAAVAAGPFVRSSYNAGQLFASADSQPA